jgi:hypothetical protein
MVMTEEERNEGTAVVMATWLAAMRQLGHVPMLLVTATASEEPEVAVLRSPGIMSNHEAADLLELAAAVTREKGHDAAQRQWQQPRQVH